MYMDPATISPDADEFVKNRVAMQQRYMKEIEQLFGPLVRAVVPLFDTEVRGVEMLKRTAAYLFAPAP